MGGLKTVRGGLTCAVLVEHGVLICIRV
ncbi:ORFL20C_IRL [Human betaherpesvirus 5]|nr:ORFL20W [Human betaherpesvirus 5]QHX40313.1 ORFL20W_TRL [Human betaherpesvirus 5]QHX40662.1 ORFL20C_IRL [Human betaherpesvirus 5]